ncbi:VOC family protein [Mesorhizobium escarrei]|uniref:2-epi-5-epi-valiolone epimerase n=1 Tax=Mesorhizobium escarrei TaxID=666018 RepID=A0ABM9E4U1_9HYPH|nr:VOC family protein [Mesorhizobium escarrei]CAH2404126.1 putative 2-epi-5-epi-valiolone epimerase [Mesorhizobium escarrei]
MPDALHPAGHAPGRAPKDAPSRLITVTHVHHTGFTVASLLQSLPFWTDVLGFELVGTDTLKRPDFVEQVTGVADAEISVAMVAGAGQIIELLEYTRPSDRRDLRYRACDTGAAHIALIVDGLDALVDRARPYGWVPLGNPQTVPEGPWAGRRVIYVRGPDGVTIEFVELARPSEGPAEATLQTRK